MIDIYEYARFFTENKHRTFFINSVTGEYIADTYKNFESDSERGEFLSNKCFFPPHGGAYLDVLKDFFIEKNKGAFALKGIILDEHISFAPFRKLLKKLNMMDEWIGFIVPFLASGFYDFVVKNGLIEEEADKNQYQLIRDLASYFDDDVIKSFSENNLFCVEIDKKKIFEAHLLGYYGGIKGLSFYIKDFDYMFYDAFRTEAPEGGLNTSTMLTNTFTLYFEGDSKDCVVNNPFGRDNTLTSISIAYGTMKRNYLSKSQAILIYTYLKNLISVIEKIFDNQRLFININPEEDCFINAKIEGKKIRIKINNQYRLTDYDFYYSFNYRRLFLITNVRMIKKKEMSFAIVVFPDYIIDHSDERIMHTPFVGLFVDEKTGSIMHMILGSDQEGEPLERLSYEMQKYFVEGDGMKELYQTIYVNEHYEYMLLNSILPSGFKIVQTPTNLATKEAYEQLVEFYNSTSFGDEADA